MLPYNAKGQLVLAVSEFVRSLWGSEETKLGDILQALDLSDSQRELLKKGIKSYLLPGQEALDRDDVSVRPSACAFQKYVSPEIFKVRFANMYSVLCKCPKFSVTLSVIYLPCGFRRHAERSM